MAALDPRLRANARHMEWPWLASVFAPLLVWGLTTSLWSVAPAHSALLAPRLAVLLTAGYFLSELITLLPSDRLHRLIRLAAGSGIALLVLVGLDIVTDLSIMTWLKGLKRGPGSNDYITYINNGVALLALFSWPIAFCLFKTAGRASALAFMCLAILAVWGGNALTPLIGMVLAALGFGVALLFGRWMLRLAYGGLAAYFLATPFIIHFFIAPNMLVLRHEVKSWSLGHRFEIWRFGVARFLEKPFFGWGLDASREIPGGRENIPDTIAEFMPLHPHSSALQIWLELGVVGAVLYLTALLFVGRRLERVMSDRVAGAFAVATFMGYAVQAQLSFGTWQNWWLSSVMFAVLLFRIAVKG
ncbi:MAG: O-antigen ligase family protein [Alphaproteobacteria bacterium]|nr:O-antigen ligase family protein [Alphaproteobacteria bacterium]